MGVLRRYVFGWYVFSREAFNSMNDTSGQDSQECWLERKKRLRARLVGHWEPYWTKWRGGKSGQLEGRIVRGNKAATQDKRLWKALRTDVLRSLNVIPLAT